MDKEELLKMAREAGFVTGEMHNRDGESTYTFIKTAGHGCAVELRNLINLVLDRAAVECEQEYYSDAGKELAEAVRALKTQ